MDIPTLLPWSDPKEVNTKAGPRLLRKAEPTPAFWDAWKSSKDELKAAGVSCSKNLQGDWEACWWQQIPEEIKAERAQAVAESRATSADIDLPRPDGLDYMPFQKAGIRYALARPNVLIGDEMGLGKTIQAIGIINSDPAIDSVLIICPKSLKLNWKRELEKWLTRPLSIGMANGKGWPETQIVIVNYEATGKYREQLLARTWGALILDEAHLIKNAKTLRSKNIKGDKKAGIEPIPAVRHIRLTGTPIVNRPIELYNIISDLHPTWANFW
jgi:SWI/SNF-related matrix-associated actin-dependent regulator 1 of chromatin subfamily A